MPDTKDQVIQNTISKIDKCNKTILPKLSTQIMDPMIIPEKDDIYKKIKIRDIIGISEYIKPPMKYHK